MSTWSLILPELITESKQWRSYKMLYSGVTSVRDMAGDSRTLAGLSRDAHTGVLLLDKSPLDNIEKYQIGSFGNKKWKDL